MEYDSKKKKKKKKSIFQQPLYHLFLPEQYKLLVVCISFLWHAAFITPVGQLVSTYIMRYPTKSTLSASDTSGHMSFYATYKLCCSMVKPLHVRLPVLVTVVNNAALSNCTVSGIAECSQHRRDQVDSMLKL